MNTKTLPELASLFRVTERTMHKHARLDTFPQTINKNEDYGRFYAVVDVVKWMIENNRKIDLQTNFGTLNEIATNTTLISAPTLLKISKEQDFPKPAFDKKYITSEVVYYIKNKKHEKYRDSGKMAFDFKQPSMQLLFIAGYYDSDEMQHTYKNKRAMATSGRYKSKLIVSVDNDW